MFDKEYQFYPTPFTLFQKLVHPYRKDSRHGGYAWDRDSIILDPSGGKGDILDFIDDDSGNYSTPTMLCCEIQAELQAILRDKGYQLVGSDWLQFEENYFFDYIIMNPPFKDGAKHLLHAIELARKTHIACILNAETLRNPHTKERQHLLNQIEQYGSFEYYDAEFVDAERKTNVEVALVWLYIEQDMGDFEFDFKDEEKVEIDMDFHVNSDSLARKDMIGNMNIRYKEVLDAYKELLFYQAKYNHYFNLFEAENDVPYNDGKDFLPQNGAPERKYMSVSVKLKIAMWRTVIGKMDMRKYMSHKVSENFDKFIKQQANMAFTHNNVEDFLMMIMGNRKNIWDQAVVDVFEELTKYHDENRAHQEGWKTNDKYKINRKVILPRWCSWGESYESSAQKKEWGAKFKIDYRDKSKYDDIDKAVAYLAGHKLMHYTTINYHLEERFEKIGKIYPGDKFDNKVQSAYFNIRFFKKGTIHLEFRDKKLWDLFNMTACSHLNWLPGPEKEQWEQEKRARREKKKREEESFEEVKKEVLMIEENAVEEIKDEFNQLTMF